MYGIAERKMATYLSQSHCSLHQRFIANIYLPDVKIVNIVVLVVIH